MQKLTALLCFVLILLLGLAGWFYLGGTLRSEVYIQTAPAPDYPEAFNGIRALLASASAPQALSGEAVSNDPAAYTLVNINVTLTNRGLFPAEWLDIRVAEPAPGDIAMYALTGEGSDIPARDSGQVNLKIITTAKADAARRIAIQYYVHGMKREITVR